VGVGGISSADTAAAAFAAGADVIQLYSGLIYEGPALLSALLREAKGRKAPPA
jgi:dihydroorotate dehydrogenase